MTGGGGRQSNPRTESITDIGFLEDRVLIAGLSNEEFASTLRDVRFPFEKADEGTSVEIYHGAHGKFETRAPVRTFVPIIVGNESVDPRGLHPHSAGAVRPRAASPREDQGQYRADSAPQTDRRHDLDRNDGKQFLLLTIARRGVMKSRADQITEARASFARRDSGSSATRRLRRGGTISSTAR